MPLSNKPIAQQAAKQQEKSLFAIIAVLKCHRIVASRIADKEGWPKRVKQTRTGSKMNVYLVSDEQLQATALKHGMPKMDTSIRCQGHCLDQIDNALKQINSRVPANEKPHYLR